MNYMTPKEAAEKWGISQRRVHTLCLEGRVKAVRHGWAWLIPEAAKKPQDARVKSGRYIKGKQNLTGEAQETTMHRPRLLEKISPPGSKLTYIHADAGYGKTILLTQYALGRDHLVYLSFDDKDNDELFFLQHLENSIKEKLHPLDFYSTDFIPFIGSKAFSATVLSAILRGIGPSQLTIIMDDVHIITNDAIIDFLTKWVMDCPPNINMIMASRHELWSSLFKLKMAGRVAELTKNDLCFSRVETEKLWGFFDAEAYTATEGWILAIQSYRIVAEGNKKFSIARLHANQNLYRYLLDEIFMRLPGEMQHFLKATSYLPELEVLRCDELLGINNSQKILEELMHRNIFTLRLSPSSYRYHTLFRTFLQQNDHGIGRETLGKAMIHCYNSADYEQAADYALILEDEGIIQDCISAMLGQPFNIDPYLKLKKYLDFLKVRSTELSPRVLLAKGMHLSDRGDFYEAEKCLSAAIDRLNRADKIVYLHAMAHQARVLRNRVSFEESNKCIDRLLPLPEDTPMEDYYVVMIEKIHNLTLTSQLSVALELTVAMMEKCLVSGSVRVKDWFERYLTAIYFYIGDYKNCLKVYEKSLSIPQEEQDWLMRHSVGTYAAKAYQVTGQEEKVLPLLAAELNKMHQLRLYEELSLIYMLNAETLHAIELLPLYQGKPADFTEANRFLGLAEEYAVLNRSTRDQWLFAKIWKICAGLLHQPEKADLSIKEATTLLEGASPFIQSVAYGRIANALDTLRINASECKEYFKKCIEIGESIDSYAYTPLAYGRLASIYLQEGNTEAAVEYAQRCLELCHQYDHRYYLRLKPLFASIMKLAADRGITPEFTREILSYGGYTAERVYINSLGKFYIAPSHDKGSPIKIRTQKARELLAYLLEHRDGVSREQIISDLWGDSEANVISLFHTRRGEIRRAFESLGAGNPILHEKGMYRLNMDEIAWDYDAFRQAADEFQRESTPENAQRVGDYYTGRYLDDLEAMWAESTRLGCEAIFLKAAEILLEIYRNSGRREEAMDLLQRCTGLSHHDHLNLYWEEMKKENI